MGFLNNLIGLATDIVVTPLAIVKDIVTLGDERGFKTADKINDIIEDVDTLIENED